MDPKVRLLNTLSSFFSAKYTHYIMKHKTKNKGGIYMIVLGIILLIILAILLLVVIGGISFLFAYADIIIVAILIVWIVKKLMRRSRRFGR